MRVTFTQNNSESGSVEGSGINWFWSGRHFEGDDNTVQAMGEEFQERLKKDWPEILEDELLEIPAVAEIDWDGSKIEVVSMKLNIQFDTGAEKCSETQGEVQQYFSEPLQFEVLTTGKNHARVNGKSVWFEIES